MTAFSVNTHRLDPYKNFKFRVILDGTVVPGVSKISPLKRSTETVLWRDGAFASHFLTAPGPSSCHPLVLERGLTHDPTFEDWAALAYRWEGDVAMSLRNFRKDMRIDLLNEQGNIALSYMVYRCWVSEYQALPELNATETTIAIERVVLSYEGFERDRAVVEPEET